MVKEYIIKNNDTVQSIAKKFFNDPSRWRDIIFYNNLTYPFITDDLDFEKETFATGSVRFYLNAVKGVDVVIPKNTVVKVEGTEKRYKTQSTRTIPAGSFFIEAEIKCEFIGYWGNAGSGTINKIDPEIADLFVINDQSLLNGISKNVKKTGEILLIPIDVEENYSKKIFDNYLENLGKEDIFLRNDIAIDDYGDLLSLTGLQNIAQRINFRLEIEKGELIYHPEYGTNFFQILGRNEPFVKKRMEIEVREVILSDEAVSDVFIESLEIKKDNVEINCNIKLINQDELENFRFLIERR